MTGEKDAPAEMPGDDARFAAAYLGFNPHDASTWDADIVNRLVRIRHEGGDQAFVQAVANLTTPPDAGIASPFNACCHREHCKALEARALAAEAALAAERERIAASLDAQANALWERCETKRTDPPSIDEQADAAQAFALQKAAAAIRAEGEIR